MKTANYTHFRFLSTLRCDCGSGGQGVAIGLALVFFAGAFSAAAGDGSIGLLALLGVIVLLSGAVKINVWRKGDRKGR